MTWVGVRGHGFSPYRGKWTQRQAMGASAPHNSRHSVQVVPAIVMPMPFSCCGPLSPSSRALARTVKWAPIT